MRDILFNQAMDAIRKMFADMSVSTATARANLEALKDEIECMLDSIKDTNKEGN